MKLLQILQKCLEDWKNISHLDFCLVNLDNTIYISTCDRALPSEEKLEEFKEDFPEYVTDHISRFCFIRNAHDFQDLGMVDIGYSTLSYRIMYPTIRQLQERNIREMIPDNV